MARARSIKPGFFRNADLVELPIETRLLFPGLWVLADRLGRLEDRPKQIKFEIFPSDAFDIDLMLNQLQASGFIERYEVDGKKYIQIINFTKHQSPHKDERASQIPYPTKHQSNTVLGATIHQSNQAGLLTAGLLTADCKNKHSGAKAPEVSPEGFDEAWAYYPQRPGRSKADAIKAWKQRVKSGEDISLMIDGIRRYSEYCKAVGTEPQYIKQPSTFFGPGKHYLSSWEIPKRTQNGNNRQTSADVIAAFTGQRQPAVFDGYSERVVDGSGAGF